MVLSSTEQFHSKILLLLCLIWVVINLIEIYVALKLKVNTVNFFCNIHD